MHKLLIAALGLALTACAEPPVLKTARALAYVPSNTPIQLGSFLPVSGLGPGESGTLKLTNAYNGLSQTYPVSGPDAKVLVDSTTLPGFRPGVKAQEYQIELTTPSDKATGTSFYVVTVAGVQIFPMDQLVYEVGTSAPTGVGPIPTPGPGAWTSQASTSAPEKFIQQFLAKWNLQNPTVTHEDVDRRDVVLPSFLKTAPDTTKFVRYEIKGQFPTYLVPKDFSSSGQADVYAPASLQVLLTQTDPSDLVSLTAK